MRVEGVGGLGEVEGHRGTERLRLGGQVGVEFVGPLNGDPVLARDQFGEGDVVVASRVRVEFEGVVVDHDRIGVRKVRQGQLELARAEIAKGTDHVAPDVDAQGGGHS